MGDITLPLWIFIGLLVLAAWAVLVAFLLPGVRWYLRRRANRVIERLNQRLHLRLQPFKLTKRQVLIDRLTHDPDVMRAVDAEAKTRDVPREELMAEVRRYAREIVPSFNAYLYFRLGYWLARRWARWLYRVRLGHVDEAALAEVPADASVVFVMNHRSNMDYVLTAYLAADRAALSYAVGEWARVWPLQSLIRAMGGYFVRRNSRGNDVYRMVLARYVAMAVQGGVVQAMFPEGGLSRNGALQEPKLGLFSYMVKGFEDEGDRDLIFIPIGLNYDRVLEDRSLLRAPDAPRQSAVKAVRITLGYIFHSFWLMLRGRWYRLGYACVNFGTPVSFRKYCAERRLAFDEMPEATWRQEVEALGNHLLGEVADVIPVLPVSLVATVFRGAGERRLSELELKAAVLRLVRRLEGVGAKIYVPRADQDYAVVVGLRMLTLRHLVVEEGGLYHANPDETAMLDYYANAIAHLVARAKPEQAAA